MSIESFRRNPREFYRANEKKFKTWLRENGSEIMAPSNAYEVLRFTTPTQIGLIHKNQKQMISSINPAAYEALGAFAEKRPWRAVPATDRNTRRYQVIHALIRRDGPRCIYCDRDLQIDEMTVEHFVALTQQGPDNLANMMIACEEHNKQAGCLSAPQKIKMILRCRGVSPPVERTAA
jgi:hypothetical protein